MTRRELFESRRDRYRAQIDALDGHARMVGVRLMSGQQAPKDADMELEHIFREQWDCSYSIQHLESSLRRMGPAK